MSDTSKCTLLHSSFTQKTIASGDGGVAMMDCTDGVRVDHCKFVGGRATNGGGLAFTGTKVGVELWLSSPLINVADSLVLLVRLHFPTSHVSFASLLF